MEKISLGLAPEYCQRGGGPGLCWQQQRQHFTGEVQLVFV